MREAVGGSMLLYLILPIIALFVCFIAFIMNYASAYRAANYIVSQYENCQGMVGNCGNIDLKTISSTIKQKYYYHDKSGLVESCNANEKSSHICCYANGDKAKVCRVTLKVTFDVPVLGEINPFNVVAETKTLHDIG